MSAGDDVPSLPIYSELPNNRTRTLIFFKKKNPAPTLLLGTLRLIKFGTDRGVPSLRTSKRVGKVAFPIRTNLTVHLTQKHMGQDLVCLKLWTMPAIVLMEMIHFPERTNHQGIPGK